MKSAFIKVFAAFLLASFGGIGCKPQPVNMTGSRVSFEPHEYKDVLYNWTREFQILPVDGVENVLTARGTYLSLEFRLAYVARVAYDLRLTQGEILNLRQSEMKALSERHEFFVTVMSGVTKSNILDQEKGDWSIRLQDEKGRQVAPVSVTKVSKPTGAETKYFSFDKGERTAYRIFFPVNAGDGRPILSESTKVFTLAFSSALGHGDMRWETKTVSRK